MIYLIPLFFFFFRSQLANGLKPADASWKTLNVLHRHAGQVAALDLGYRAGVPDTAAAKFVYLLGSDNPPKELLRNAFVVYQGSHICRCNLPPLSSSVCVCVFFGGRQTNEKC